MPIIEVPGLGNVEFPEGTPEKEMLSAVQQAQKDYSEIQSANEPGLMQQIGRQTGLAVRGLTDVAGAGALAGAALAAPTGIGVPPAAAVGAGIATGMDLTARAYNYIADQFGATGRLPVLGDVLEQVKTDIGLPRPVTPTEKMAQSAMGAGTSALSVSGLGAGLMKSASPSIRALGTILSGEPYKQIGANVTGSIASSLAEQEGAGPAGQAAAGVVGAMSPALPAIAKSGVQGLLRAGVSREQIAKNIESFAGAGTTPTAGQAIGRGITPGAESTIGKIPFARGTILRKGAEQQGEIRQKVEQIAEELSRTTEPAVAGAGIARGVKESFIPASRQVETGLYNQLGNFIPRTQPISAGNTLKAMSQMVSPIEGAPALSRSRLLTSPEITDLRDKLISDMTENAGTIPFSALKGLRSKIGEKLSTVNLVADVSQGEYKKIYAALSDDLRTAATQAGPRAEAALSRANKYSKAFHSRIEKLQGFINKNEPEKVYQSAFEGSSLGATRLRSVLQSIPKEDQKAVVSSFVSRMGKSLPGRQNELGDTFSSETFLTNYNRLSKDAKNTLFGRFGSQFQNDIRKIAETSARVRESARVLANPSGTAAAGFNIGTYGGLAGSISAGKYNYAAGILASIAAAEAGGRLFTNPRFVGWLAKNIEIPTEQIPAATANLLAIATKTNDEDLAQMAENIKRGNRR